MKYVTKVLSIIIIVLFLLQSTTIAKAESSDAKIIEFISSIGIIDGDNFKMEDYLTRGELASVVVKLSGNESLVSHGTTDEYIKVACDLGYMQLYSDGKFESEYSTKKEDAAKAFVMILGYEKYAETKGGYPHGYLFVAYEQHIFSGAEGKYLTKSQAARIIYNVMNTDVLNQVSFSGSHLYEAVRGKNILTENLNIKKIKGRLTRNQFTGLTTADILTDNYVEINEQLYNAGKTNAADFLGCSVEAYVSEDENGENKIIYISEDNNDIVKIEADNIDEQSTAFNIIQMENNYNKKKSYKVAENADFIYNGRMTLNLKNEEIKPKCGSVELVDFNGDNVYDVVKITSYEDIITDIVYLKDKCVMGKGDKKLDLNDVDYFISGTEDIKDLAEWDVLSIAVSKDGKLANIIVTKDVVSGTVSGLSEDIVSINGEEYDTDVQLFMNDSGNFYLNSFGKIAAFNRTTEESGYVYGYLFNASEGIGLNQTLQLEILTESGEFEIFDCAKNMKVDGITYKNTEDYLNSLKSDLGYKQLIRYQFNMDGDIGSIDTQNMKEDENEDSLRVSSTGISITYISVISMLSAKCFISDKTKVFVVPSGIDRDEKKAYGIRTRSQFVNSEYCTFTAYSMNENYDAEALVLLKETREADNKHLLMIDKIINTIDEEDGEVQKVQGYLNGKKVELVGAEQDVFKGLKKGDVINYTTDSMQRVMKCSIYIDGGNLKSTQITSADGDSRYHSTSRWFFGMVTERNGRRIKASIFNQDGLIDKSLESIYELKSSAIIVFDRAKNEVYTGGVEDLDSIIYHKNPNARIFMYQVYSTVVYAYIYK